MRAPFSAASSKAPFTRKALTACAAASLALGLGMGTASALPPGGAKASTPGTSSTVSSSVTEHGVISFTLSGFPANTQVSVKVDDGDLCPSDAAQGACVVHQQMSDGNGNVSGSFVLPDVGTGKHTLRFLATGEKRDKDGKYLGTEAYTNRSSEFTVTSEGGSDSSNSSKSSSHRTGSEDSSNSQGDESNGEVETVYTDAEGNVISKEEYDRLNAEAGSSESASASAEPKETVKATASASASSSAPARGSASVPSASASASSSSVNNAEKTVQTVTYGAAFPWVGVIVLGLSLVAAAAVLVIRKR
nr:plasmid partitioning protein [uncultured Rothia sp.]